MAQYVLGIFNNLGSDLMLDLCVLTMWFMVVTIEANGTVWLGGVTKVSTRKVNDAEEQIGKVNKKR